MRAAAERELSNRELEMNANIESTSRKNWLSRLLRMLALWDEALSTGPLESLERRVSALEQKTLGSSDREHR